MRFYPNVRIRVRWGRTIIAGVFLLCLLPVLHSVGGFTYYLIRNKALAHIVIHGHPLVRPDDAVYIASFSWWPRAMEIGMFLANPGGPVHVPPNYSETLSANLVMSKNNSGWIFDGPATITTGTNTITCANGIVMGGYIIGPSLLGAVVHNGNGGGATYSYNASSTVFKYTGNAAFINCGDATNPKTGFRFENFGIDLTGAGTAAIGIDSINWQDGNVIRGISILGAGNGGGNVQVGMQLDPGGGQNPFVVSYEDNELVNLQTGFVMNATAQEVFFYGNQVQGATLGCTNGIVFNGAIGQYWAGGNISGCTNFAIFNGVTREVELNTVANGNITFASGTTANTVRYQGTAIPTVTDNNLASSTSNRVFQANNNGAAEQSALTANVPATNIVTGGFQTRYRASLYTIVTQAATTSSTLPTFCVLWTDPNGVAQNWSSGPLTGNTLTTYQSTTTFFMAKFGINLQYATGTNCPGGTGYTSVGATPMQYRIDIAVEQTP